MHMDLKQVINEEAFRLGFSAIGVAPADYDPLRHNEFLRWLDNGYHADMKYLERGQRTRFDPKIHLPSAKSVIICAQNYYHEPDNDPAKPYISIYARGENYHSVMREKLDALCGNMTELFGHYTFDICVDSSTIAEKWFAAKAGLGFLGRNGLLILSPTKKRNEARGSFHFLGAIITDLEIETDIPNNGNCGQCRRCIDACPTKAIMEDGLIDASRCISYHTTQSKESIPPEIAKEMGNIIFGCDICQMVCPHNSNLTETSEPRLRPNNQIPLLTARQLIDLTEDDFKTHFVKSSLGEKKFPIFKRNIAIAAQNIRDQYPKIL
jgi:epoxyqueuosine reductase